MARGIILKPNLGMSENLAYLLGAIKGDGHISKDKKYLHINKKCWHRQYKIVFTNQNFDFLREVYHCMKDIGLRPKIYNGTNIINISSCSKIMWEWYQRLTITDLEKMLKQNRKYLLAFLRGFYEAEGCYYYETRLNRPFVVITNSNEELISFVHKLICELGFYAKLYKIKRGKTAFKKGYFYNICIRKKGEVENFIDMIEPCFKKNPSNSYGKAV
jgi:intein/homing endonuclease